MDKIILILCLFTIFAGNYQNAWKTSRKALLKQKTVKKYTKTIERNIAKKIRINKEVLAAMTTLTIQAAHKKINTDPLKKTKIRLNGATIHPKIEYNLRNKNTQGLLKIIWKIP
jgi:hypothetical protein